MLSPEAAKEQLQNFLIEQKGPSIHVTERLLPDARKLPTRLRPIGYALLNRDTNGEQEWGTWRDRVKNEEEQYAILDQLPKKDRLQLFRTFLPTLADDVEVTWQWLKSAAYPSVVFRSPKCPEYSHYLRGDWVKSFITAVEDIKPEALSPAWLAAWLPHLSRGWRNHDVARLLAATIDAKGKQADEVFDILCQSAVGEHEIGAMGSHVTLALLSANRPAGWELIEKMLLAAQRQEGLRQTILESAAQAHPQAFQRILRLIVDEKLSRFSSVVQAMDQWFKLAWASAGTKIVNDTICKVADLLETPKLSKEAFHGSDAEAAYLALWATAFEEITDSIEPAQELLNHERAEFRFVAALHLSRCELPTATNARIKALDDEDLRVAIVALGGNNLGYSTADLPPGKPLFEALERLFARIKSKRVTLKPLVWPWTEFTIRRDDIGRLLVDALGNQPVIRLLPHIKTLGPQSRWTVARLIAAQESWDKPTRDMLLDMAGDTSADAQRTAVLALHKAQITPSDATTLEEYLTRTASELRNGIVSLLLSLTNKEAMASAVRLLESTNKYQRLAGLEILRQLAEADRSRSECIKLAKGWHEGRKRILKEEQSQLDAILDSDREVLTLENALGLMDPDQRTSGFHPKKKKVRCVTNATPSIWKSLDDLVHKHRETPIPINNLLGESSERLLGEISYGFPSPKLDKPLKEQIGNLPISDVLESWYQKRPAALKDKDGLELLRCFVHGQSGWYYGQLDLNEWLTKSPNRKPIGDLLVGNLKMPKLRYGAVISELVDWLLLMHPPKGGFDFCLDVIETIGAMIPAESMKAITAKTKPDSDDEDRQDWRNLGNLLSWLRTTKALVTLPGERTTKQQYSRFWNLLCWMDEPFAGAKRDRPDLQVAAEAYLRKIATLDDVADQLLGPQEAERWGLGFYPLRAVTAIRPDKPLREFLAREEIANLVNRCRDRVFEVELARGEAATVCSKAALSIQAYWGIDNLLTLLKSLGKDGFKKVTAYHAQTSDNRVATFTQMVQHTYPAPDESAEDFSRAAKQAIKDGAIPEERLLELAFLAPQWTAFVETTLNWKGLAEGLYWYMAHMGHEWSIASQFEMHEETESENDASNGRRPKKLSYWEKLLRERTSLTQEERLHGAIDVNWFHRTYKQLKPKRWQAMADAAKFAESGTSRKRAQLITNVLLGKTSKKEIIVAIRQRHLKEYVRLLGLLPLATGAKRQKDIFDRYEMLQEYRRYANKLSSMSKPDAMRALEMGLKNLAATAGYEDPMRLQWAMEAEQTKDLANGPVVVSKGDISLTLSLDSQAQPELSIRRGDKVLKSLPKAVNKDPRFIELRERSTQLKRQAGRVNQSLEAAMCRGDAFTGAELMQLADHAILWPQFERLIVQSEGIMGYPTKRGKALIDHQGNLEPVKKSERFRIAHPYDLLQSKAWHKWQHECFATERLQPFKQVFRELYVITAQEKQDKSASSRYAGQQVNPRQAFALWGTRGWSVDQYENVFKAFPDEAINVSISFDHGYTTPLEVEGLTIDKVQFFRRGEFTPVELVDVPPRIFSETMRDIDLVVSVAHIGQVDPEASASTVEMRANLLRETCQLLSLKNVELNGSRALIKGQLGEYTVHLGSGVVHRMPGGSICIVPVHAQHRGRLFLPFADDDPRTAEVVSKTLLLSRDDEIQDPIILDQLRAAT